MISEGIIVDVFYYFKWSLIQSVNAKGNQSWIFIGRTDAETETPILWPPDAKNWLIEKDPEAEKDWRLEEKGMAWTVAYQVPPSMGFSRQEYWSGLPFPSPRDLPNPRIEPGSPKVQADSLPSELPAKPQ